MTDPQAVAVLAEALVQTGYQRLRQPLSVADFTAAILAALAAAGWTLERAGLRAALTRERLASILHGTSPDCRLLPVAPSKQQTHASADSNWAVVVLHELAPFLAAAPAPAIEVEATAAPGLRAALDVERLARAVESMWNGPNWKGTGSLEQFAQDIAAAYDAEGAIPTPGSGGQQVGASGSGQPTPASPEVGD